MPNIETLSVSFIAEVQKFNKNVRAVEKRIKSVQKDFGALSKTVVGVGATLAGLGITFGTITWAATCSTASPWRSMTRPNDRSRGSRRASSSEAGA